MFNNLSTPQILAIILGACCLYLVIIAAAYGKRLVGAWGKLLRAHAPAASPAVSPSASLFSRAPVVHPDLFPGLIDRPAPREPEPSEFDELYEPSFMAVEEEQMTLLKEAERVVEQIQSAVHKIESYPANPDEVLSKIRSIVSQYTFFLDTEYYDAINSFVAITVQRDCDLRLTEDDIKALWYAEAA